MGIEPDNWPAVLGIVSGVLAKEVIVGTLDTVYGRIAAEDAPAQSAEPFALGASLLAAAATVPRIWPRSGAAWLIPSGCASAT
jgi:ferrous iron transport protein B